MHGSPRPSCWTAPFNNRWWSSIEKPLRKCQSKNNSYELADVEFLITGEPTWKSRVWALRGSVGACLTMNQQTFFQKLRIGLHCWFCSDIIKLAFTWILFGTLTGRPNINVWTQQGSRTSMYGHTETEGGFKHLTEKANN